MIKENNMEEIWKPVEGRPAYYVSNLGRVLSLKRKDPQILAIHQNRLGYAEVSVFSHCKVGFINLGREVLAAFKGYPAEPWLCVARHINGDLMDCRLENLEWVVCETDDTYDPKSSHRKGVLRPEHTKDRMTEAKLKQSEDTIRKAIMTRQKNVQMRKFFKQVNEEPVLPENRKDEITDIYTINKRLNGE